MSLCASETFARVRSNNETTELEVFDRATEGFNSNRLPDDVNRRSPCIRNAHMQRCVQLSCRYPLFILSLASCRGRRRYPTSHRSIDFTPAVELVRACMKLNKTHCPCFDSIGSSTDVDDPMPRLLCPSGDRSYRLQRDFRGKSTRRINIIALEFSLSEIGQYRTSVRRLPKNENSFPPRSKVPSGGKVNSLSVSLFLSLSLSFSFSPSSATMKIFISACRTLKESSDSTWLLKDYRYCATFKVARMKRGKAIS